MINSQSTFNKSFNSIFWLFGIVSFIGIAGYGLSYILKMPEISPNEFVPKTIDTASFNRFGFGNLLAVFILLYAFAFLPIVIQFSIIKYKTNPYAIIISCCFLAVSLILEIVNNLPLISSVLLPVNIDSIPVETLLYIRQLETIKYLAFDVAGFSLAYTGFLIYAIIFYKTNRLLSYTIIASILLFIANVPFLLIEPSMAIILMAISIFAFALVPIFMVKMCSKQ
ncbi:hypothetical protein [Xiashengella succiniciproducens]|jgi:hypothetical protein|uniref:DUF4386 domain-containing protein n=1 Tax=Xiashengella succiniciproducens TaxID=2949635 RepID=A0A9J6ZTG4_9BACT|nr:hypothetical protein [Alkaliflexus sp. Ai-910]URW80894.1 hypothetical protein M9189_05960 [Alkaliflexus sp. Ai-910]